MHKTTEEGVYYTKDPQCITGTIYQGHDCISSFPQKLWLARCKEQSEKQLEQPEKLQARTAAKNDQSPNQAYDWDIPWDVRAPSTFLGQATNETQAETSKE